MRAVRRNLLEYVVCESGKLAVLVVPLATTVVLLAFGQACAKAPTSQPFSGPVPRAVCGPGERPETGLQGVVTLEDCRSGAVYDGFKCNLDLVGTFEGEGTS